MNSSYKAFNDEFLLTTTVICIQDSIRYHYALDRPVYHAKILDRHKCSSDELCRRDETRAVETIKLLKTFDEKF